MVANSFRCLIMNNITRSQDDIKATIITGLNV